VFNGVTELPKSQQLEMVLLHFTLSLELATVEIRLWPDLLLEIRQNPAPVGFRKTKSDTALILTVAKQGIHRHQTSPRYSNAASGSRLKVQPSTHRYTANYGQI